MGRGGRNNRKRRRGEDGVNNNHQEEKSAPPRLDVSFWNGADSSPSGGVPPATLQAQQLQQVAQTGETPPDWDPTVWQYLQSTWLSLQRRRHHPDIWTEPTPIQLQSWPILLQQPQRYNLVQVSQTGSGKTQRRRRKHHPLACVSFLPGNWPFRYRNQSKK
jgi:hypothetical protein